VAAEAAGVPGDAAVIRIAIDAIVVVFVVWLILVAVLSL
jgi:hypothetical protein